MKSYVDKLAAKVRELEAHPNVVLLNWDVGEPASVEDVEAVERHLGFALDPAIKAFYRQADGLSLRWIDRDNPRFDEKKHERVNGRLVPGFISKTRIPEGLDVIGNDGADDGCICITPLRETFIDAEWEGHTWFSDWMNDEESVKFGKKKYGLLSFRKALRIFDYFNFYEMSAFFCLDAKLPVIVGTDHGADWDAKPLDFASYMQFVLDHYGSTCARSQGFVHGKAPKKVPADVDAVLAACRAADR